jgi:O-antigen/teichoic acid export membrane protein
MQFLRFFGFNLLGNLLPMLVALIVVPVIARYAGVERLDALGVVWALVGYFGFLDFGLSRVVTRRVARAGAGRFAG